jgi:hypothetical protein
MERLNPFKKFVALGGTAGMAGLAAHSTSNHSKPRLGAATVVHLAGCVQRSRSEDRLNISFDHPIT